MKKTGFIFESPGVQKSAEEVKDLEFELSKLNKELASLKKEGDKGGFIKMGVEIEKLKEKKRTLTTQINKTRRELEKENQTLDDLVKKFRIGGVSVGEFQTGLKNTTQGLKLSKQALLGNVTALRAVAVAVGATGIGLLVIALGALYQYLTKNQEGMDKLQRVMAVVGSVVDNLIERAIILGKAVYDLASGRVLQAWDGLVKTVSGFGKELVEDAKAASKLTEQAQQLRDEERGMNVILAERKRRLKEVSLIAENTHATEEDRRKAAEEGLAITKQIEAIETNFLNKKIENLRKIQSLGETTAQDEAELAELIAQREDKRTAAIEAQTTINSKLNTVLDAQKKKLEETAQGPLDRMREKLEDIGKLIGGGSLQGDALRQKIEEMLNLREEVAEMEKSISAIAKEVAGEVNQGITPLQTLDLGGDGIQALGILSVREEEERAKAHLKFIQEAKNESDLQLRSKAIENLQKMREDEEKVQAERLDAFRGFSNEIGNLVGEVFSGQIDKAKEFEQALLETLISGVEKAINVLLAQAFARQFGDQPAPLAIAAFGVIQGLVKGFFSGVKASVARKNARGRMMEDGALLHGPSHAHGGIPIAHDEFEGGEAIINKHSTAKFRPLLSAINSYNNWGRKFATGGIRHNANIPAFLSVSQAQQFATGNNTVIANVGEESIAAMATALGTTVQKAIGLGLYDANRNNERFNVLQQTTRL